jgi:hypothetical protein
VPRRRADAHPGLGLRHAAAARPLAGRACPAPPVDRRIRRCRVAQGLRRRGPRRVHVTHRARGRDLRSVRRGSDGACLGTRRGVLRHLGGAAHHASLRGGHHARGARAVPAQVSRRMRGLALTIRA